MGKKHKKHQSEETDEQGTDKPTALKLVLKVGAPYTPSDATSADSQSESVDNDSEKKTKPSKKKHQSEKVDHQEKKRKLDDSEDESADDDEMQTDVKSPLFDVAEFEDPRGPRSLREKRPTFAYDEEKTALQICLEYLHKILKRKDANGFFAFPVTENIAPGYYSIITRPMDFSTMKAKIHNGDYHSVAEYKADFKLMMQNCMQYNRQDTVYHREAKRLLNIGFKFLSRERLLQMKRNLPSMSALTSHEMGFDDEADMAATAAATSDAKSKQVKQKATTKKQSLSRFEAIPDKFAPDEVLEQAQSAAEAAADKLSLCAPNSKIGFLRRCEDGSTTLKILNPENSGIVSEKEQVVSLGELIGKLPAGAGSLTGLKDDRRNKVSPVNYLSYDVFSSYAPIYDSSSSNLSKEDSDLLLTTYCDEAGVQYAKSLQHFVSNCSEYAVHMVDNLLDILTDCEHSKTNALLLQKEQERQKQEEDELKKQQEKETGVQQSADSQHPKSESQRLLDRVSELIASLHQVQNARLTSPPPAHLSEVSGPTQEETDLAQKVSSELVSLIKQVAPSDVVAQRTIRNALGITCEPAATSSSSVDLPNVPASSAAASASKQQELDADITDFFAQGTSDQPIVI